MTVSGSGVMGEKRYVGGLNCVFTTLFIGEHSSQGC